MGGGQLAPPPALYELTTPRMRFSATLGEEQEVEVELI
jgi:hypothetical protein